jgi:hypothetical protein
MAILVVEGDQLIMRMTTLEHVEGFHQDITVPLSAVRAVRVSANVWSELRGIRAPGTGIPHVVAVGTRRGSFGKDFAAVHGTGRGVVVELSGQPYGRLVLTVDDPDALVQHVADATRPH